MLVRVSRIYVVKKDFLGKTCVVYKLGYKNAGEIFPQKTIALLFLFMFQ
jgi:hypothetical protein